MCVCVCVCVCVFIEEGGGGKSTVGIKNADASTLCPIKYSFFFLYTTQITFWRYLFFLICPSECQE